MYGTGVSTELISRVTDAVWAEITAWQSRPLERVYAVVWLDTLFVKMRDKARRPKQCRLRHRGLGLDRHKAQQRLSAT
jgi:transposase-like protein